MSEDRATPGGPAVALGRADRVTQAQRALLSWRRGRARLLCLTGRHWWAQRHNPEVGGRRAAYQTCRRCGRERDEYLPGWQYFAR